MSTAARSRTAPSPPRRLYVAEPRPAYRREPPLVVDSSAIVAGLFEEAEAEQALQAMAAHELHAPSLLSYELANVARTKIRAGAPPERVTDALQAYEGLAIALHPPEPRTLHALALAHDLSTYDAAYLALAIRLQAPLLTFDQRLAAAAERALGRRD